MKKEFSPQGLRLYKLMDKMVSEQFHLKEGILIPEIMFLEGLLRQKMVSMYRIWKEDQYKGFVIATNGHEALRLASSMYDGELKVEFFARICYANSN